MNDAQEGQQPSITTVEELLTRLFHTGAAHAPAPLSEMPNALALLVHYNPGTLLSHIPAILTQEAEARKWIANIPYPHKRFWDQFYALRTTERLIIVLFTKSRIHLFLSSMVQHWNEEQGG